MKTTLLMAVVLLAAVGAARVAWGVPLVTIDPSRTSGVAPLAVFFDASGTTSTNTSYPFTELSYHWSFGDDPNAKFKLTTNRPKNESLDPVAGHVFETPGTYTVTLTVRDSGNSIICSMAPARMGCRARLGWLLSAPKTRDLTSVCATC